MSYNGERRLVEVDGRRRVSLGDMARHKYYLASMDEDGVITLIPAMVIPASRYEELQYEALRVGEGDVSDRPASD